VTAVLLSLHVLAAILAVGPVCVAASMFPPEARRAAEYPAAGARLQVLGRICRTYALIGVAVPALGIATALAMGVLTEAWVLVSIVLTAAAAGVLAGVVLPRQRALLDGAASDGLAALTGRLAGATGVFNLLWATVTVLMIVRPGSTTGV
jgi:sulfite exporter TauE/SafE